MSKKLMAIVAMIACFLFAFAGCGGNTSVSVAKDETLSTVSSNGGFLVESGDYVYFVNGNELYTESNKQGEVTKGSLVRVKKDNLSKGKDANPEVVVSKLLSTADYTSGLYLANGKIYFATPSAETNKKGEVQYDDVKFCYADLSNESVTIKEFATAKGSNAVVYKFYEVDGKVYVAFTASETVTEDGAEVTKNYIKVVCEDGTETKEEYETYVFDKGEGDYIYFTKSVENKELDITESFNELYRWKVGGVAEKVYTGAGAARNNAEFTASAKKGVSGVKFTLIASEKGFLYFSVANVDTSTGTVTYYANLSESATVAADTEANYDAIVPMTYNGSTAVFVATSYFEAPNCIVYLDTTNGLCAYDYTKSESYDDAYGVKNLYYSEDIITGTLAYVSGEYLYYQISGVYYRLAYKATRSGDTATVEVGKEEAKLSPVAFSTTWYAPEVVKAGEKEYIIGTTTSADYFDYIFAYEIKSNDEEGYDAVALEDDAIKAYVEGVYAGEENEEELEDVLDEIEKTTFGEFITATKRESVKYVWDTYGISMLDKYERTEVELYVDLTYPLASADTTTTEDEGCSSAISGLAIGGAILALAGVAIFKKRG